jgi:hypothetical protein
MLSLREIILASRHQGIERLEPENLIDLMHELKTPTFRIDEQYIRAMFALSDIAGELTYDTIDFSEISPASFDKTQFPWHNYSRFKTSDNPIDYIEFGISKKTGEIEARIHLLTKEVLIRRQE